MAIIPWIIGVLGLIVGSFLNVVVLRQGKQSISGRSACPQCHKKLTWYELIPVVSFIIQSGKCRGCEKKISVQYPLVELGTGILFYTAGVFIMNNLSYLPMIQWGIILALLLLTLAYGIIIIVYDMIHRLIPVTWLIGLVTVSLVYLATWYGFQGFFDESILGIVWFHIQGILVAVPFFVLWKISRGAWIGFGDIEIIAWMGVFFGILTGISAVLLAFYLGGLVALGIILKNRIQKKPYHAIRGYQIAFAPFLISAWILTELFAVNVFTWFL